MFIAWGNQITTDLSQVTDKFFFFFLSYNTITKKLTKGSHEQESHPGVKC